METELKCDDFNGETLNNQGTLAAVFLASWCPFCTRFYPAFQAAADKDHVSWASVDISNEENPLWEVFNIRVVPTIIIFKDGKAAFRKDGGLGRGLSQKAIDESIGQMKLLSTAS